MGIVFPENVDDQFRRAIVDSIEVCEAYLGDFPGCVRFWFYADISPYYWISVGEYFEMSDNFLSSQELAELDEESDRDFVDISYDLIDAFDKPFLRHLQELNYPVQRIIVSYDRVSGVVSAEFDAGLRIDPDNILRSSELLIDEWIVSHGGRALLDRPAVSPPLEADCEEEEEFEVRETQVVFPEYVDQMCEDGLEYWGDLPGLERLWIYTMFTEIGGISTQVFFETGDAFLNSIQLQDFGDGRDSYDFNSDLMEYQVVDELLESVDGVEPRPTRAITVRDLATGVTEAEWTTEPVIDPAIPDDNYIDVRDRWIIAHGGVALNEKNRI